MKLANKFKYFLLPVFVWSILILPIFACKASSGLASVWEENSQSQVKMYMPIDFDGLTNMGIFFVYLLIVVGAMFAFSIIMIGSLKMFTASGNEDNYRGAKHSLIAGIISLLVSLILFFSLNSVIVIAKEIASKFV